MQENLSIFNTLYHFLPPLGDRKKCSSVALVYINFAKSIESVLQLPSNKPAFHWETLKLSLSLFLVCCHYYNGVGTQARAVCECVQNAKFLKLQNSQYCYNFVFLICLRYKINGLIVSVFQLCTKVSGSIINLTISLTLHFKSVVLSDECANSQSLYITYSWMQTTWTPVSDL